MRTLGFAVLLALAVGAGCTPSDPVPTTPAPAAAIPVEMTEGRYEAIDGAVNERKGKVVLVDFWATWCAPCVKKFPHFVETHKKFADKGLACMSVSLDPRGKADKYDKDAVLKFLKDKGATFPNFILLGYQEDEEKINKRFGLDGGIPFLALFGKDGKRVWTSEDWAGKEWSEEKYNEELDKLIETELAK